MILKWLSRKISRTIENEIDTKNSTEKPSIWTRDLSQNKYVSWFIVIIFLLALGSTAFSWVERILKK